MGSKLQSYNYGWQAPDDSCRGEREGGREGGMSGVLNHRLSRHIVKLSE